MCDAVARGVVGSGDGSLLLFSQCPFKARQASTSRTSDVDGLLPRFSGKAIASPPTTELLHRSRPALNSLAGFAIDRAGSAKRTDSIVTICCAKIKRRLRRAAQLPRVSLSATVGSLAQLPGCLLVPTSRPAVFRLPGINYYVIISRALIAPGGGNDMADHRSANTTRTPHLACRHPHICTGQPLIPNRNTPPFKFPPTP